MIKFYLNGGEMHKMNNENGFFVPKIEPDMDKKNDSLWFVYCKNEVLIYNKQDKSKIPTYAEIIKLGISLESSIYIGELNNVDCYGGELNIDEHSRLANGDYKFITLRALFETMESEIFFAAGRAYQMMQWNNNTCFCGRCGSKNEQKKDERAKKCPSCGLVSYPRISPAIIVAVVKGDKLLLAHNANFPAGRFSVIAGFVEVGETFEQCVMREVNEEVGIRVKNIKYFGSQPWPFPDSLMVGFTAEYDSGEIQVDNKEIAEANWFKADELPNTPSNNSIARKLIDWFAHEHPIA